MQGALGKVPENAKGCERNYKFSHLKGAAQAGAECRDLIEFVRTDVALMKADSYAGYKHGKLVVVVWSLNDLMLSLSKPPKRDTVSYSETSPEFPPTLEADINTLCNEMLRNYDRSVVLLPDDFSIFAPGVQPARWIGWCERIARQLRARGVMVLPSRLILTRLQTATTTPGTRGTSRSGRTSCSR